MYQYGQPQQTYSQVTQAQAHLHWAQVVAEIALFDYTKNNHHSFDFYVRKYDELLSRRDNQSEYYTQDEIDLIDYDILCDRVLNKRTGTQIILSNDELTKLQQIKSIRKQQRKARHEYSIYAGIVNADFNKRTSSILLKEQHFKNIRTAEFLSSHVVFNKSTGQAIDLTKTFERKISEFRAVAKGLRVYGERAGMTPFKAVVTLPSRFHANPSYGEWGSWEGFTPSESRQVLQTQWARCRAALWKSGIKIAGFWTLETHTDGCPHVNFIYYAPHGSEQEVLTKFNEYMNLDGDERAVKIEKLQTAKKMNDRNGNEYEARFENYASKCFESYISKNLDNLQNFDDLKNDDGDTMALAEQTAASAQGWRRWGFFGLPSLSIWRRYRALSDAPQGESQAHQSAWRAARASDFARFIGLMGGLAIHKHEVLIKTIYWPSETGKSRICVGVECIKTGETLITKAFGFQILSKVTLNITNPSGVCEIKKTLPVPPLITNLSLVNHGF